MPEVGQLPFPTNTVASGSLQVTVSFSSALKRCFYKIRSKMRTDRANLDKAIKLHFERLRVTHTFC